MVDDTSVGVPRARAGIGAILLRVAAGLLVLVLVYVAALWYQAGQALERGDGLLDESNRSVVALKEAIESFRGDPESAEILTPQLDAERAGLERLGARAPEITADLLPPLGAVAEPYPVAFQAYVAQVGSYYDDLSKIAAYVLARADAMTEVGEGLAVLNDLALPGNTEADIARIVGEARAAVDESSARIRALGVGPVEGPVVYSSEALVSRMSRISDALSEIEEGLAEKNADRVEKATRDFSSLVSADWQGLFFVADQDGLARFRSSLQDMDADRQAFIEARDRLASYRTTLWAVGFGLLVAAVFVAALAWLR